MLKVQTQIETYNNLVNSLTVQGTGLKALKNPNVWYDYINEFDNISEELKNLHIATYKIEDGNEDSIINGADPNEMTIPEMINNIDQINTSLTTSYEKVKKQAALTVLIFKENLLKTEDNIKDVVANAAILNNKKDIFAKSKLTLVINGVPEPDSPDLPVYDNITLNWEAVPGAKSYIITWTLLTPEVKTKTLLVNQYETTNPHVDIAVVMHEKGVTPGDYSVSVASKGAVSVSPPSEPINFTLLPDSNKIKLINVLPVTKDGGTGLNSELSNVGKYTIDFIETDSINYTAKITVTNKLTGHESTAGMGNKKWIGMLVKTNRDITGLEIKSKISTSSFSPLEENEVTDAFMQGVKDRGTFVFWITDEDNGRVMTLRRADNPSVEISLTIEIIPFVPPIETWTTRSYETFAETTWTSDLAQVQESTATELVNNTVLTQTKLEEWDKLESTDVNYAVLTRYVEIDALGGTGDTVAFDAVHIKIDGTLIEDQEGLPIVVLDSSDIDAIDDGWACVVEGKTRFKNAITFARKVESTWELLNDRLGKDVEYVFLNNGVIVATANGGKLPVATLSE